MPMRTFIICRPGSAPRSPRTRKQRWKDAKCQRKAISLVCLWLLTGFVAVMNPDQVITLLVAVIATVLAAHIQDAMK